MQFDLKNFLPDKSNSVKSPSSTSMLLKKAQIAKSATSKIIKPVTNTNSPLLISLWTWNEIKSQMNQCDVISETRWIIKKRFFTYFERFLISARRQILRELLKKNVVVSSKCRIKSNFAAIINSVHQNRPEI